MRSRRYDVPDRTSAGTVHDRLTLLAEQVAMAERSAASKVPLRFQSIHPATEPGPVHATDCVYVAPGATVNVPSALTPSSSVPSPAAPAPGCEADSESTVAPSRVVGWVGVFRVAPKTLLAPAGTAPPVKPGE
jgi:hypothetical protein